MRRRSASIEKFGIEGAKFVALMKLFVCSCKSIKKRKESQNSLMTKSVCTALSSGKPIHDAKSHVAMQTIRPANS
jgi:hypothetical protein